MSTSGKKTNFRQQKLKQERGKKNAAIFWRSLIAIALLGGLGWFISRPNWIIKSSSQIDISGNEILSQEAVRAMISLSYPQSIFQLPIPEIDQNLESLPPLSEVTVTRQLLPPQVQIMVVERIPVAIALDPQKQPLGFIDSQGVLLPEKYYLSVKENFKLPNLTVIDYRQENSLYWSQLYQSLIQTNLKIKQIDWRDSGNLILDTELGPVHLGGDRNLLNKQLQVLEQMLALPSQVDIHSIDYIDISNPDNPLIQVFEVQEKSSSEEK